MPISSTPLALSSILIMPLILPTFLFLLIFLPFLLLSSSSPSSQSPLLASSTIFITFLTIHPQHPLPSLLSSPQPNSLSSSSSLLLHCCLLSLGGRGSRDRADLLAVVIGAAAVTIHCHMKTVTTDIYCSSIPPVVSITLLPGLASNITVHCRLWTRGQCHENAFIEEVTWDRHEHISSVGAVFRVSSDLSLKWMSLKAVVP